MEIINASIETGRKLNDYLSETQYRFVAKKDTTDAIVPLKIVIQTVIIANKGIIACFID